MKNKLIKQLICGGHCQIAINPLGERQPAKHLSIWLSQGFKGVDGMHGTMYHVSTVGGELDELITKLIEIRDKKDEILRKFNDV
jgi:hypothetical protein